MVFGVSVFVPSRTPAVAWVGCPDNDCTADNGPGTPDRHCRSGTWSASLGPRHDAACAGRHQPGRAVPDRLRQRRGAGALHAAVRAPGFLRSDAAGPGRRHGSAPGVRVLGACRLPDRREPAPRAALPDGRACRPSVAGHAADPDRPARAAAESARPGGAAGAADVARDRTRAGAGAGRLVELVGREVGPGVVVLHRRAHQCGPEHGVRTALRPAGTGPARRRGGGTDDDCRGGPG